LVHVWEKGGAYRVFVGKLEGKGALDRLRRRLEENMKVNLEGNKLWRHGLY
jgi:hypothetical protein